MPDKKLKSTGITLDGTPIALRPLLPEDEPALQDLFAHMSREDVRLRFFTPMRELKHALAARLSHLDYSREMALVAQHDGMTLGVARYSADPDQRSAEFAVAVRSDWHGRGVGQLLMARLIEVAQQSGISELVGLVLHENKPMLKMCRKLGFSIAPEPNDATVQVSHDAEGSVQRVEIVDPQAGAAGRRPGIDRDREELQRDRPAIEDHPAVVLEAHGEPKPAVEVRRPIEVCARQIGGCAVHGPALH